MQSFSVFSVHVYLLLSLALSILEVSPEYFCPLSPRIFAAATDGPPPSSERFCTKPIYPKVTNPIMSPSHLPDLPWFTRSVYKKDHALITPESQVFSPLPNWTDTLGAYLISPAMGSHFFMYWAKMQENSKSGDPPSGVERFIFVVEGAAVLESDDSSHDLKGDFYAYLPPGSAPYLSCKASATLVVFERRYSYDKRSGVKKIVNSTDKQPLVKIPGEIFELRKLLPTSGKYDFNIHIMDFQPGEFLNMKEVHHNQHGLLLLEGQGIYRLGESWYPVQAGDAIWTAPFGPQSYAALGKSRSRFLLYKDVANTM